MLHKGDLTTLFPIPFYRCIVNDYKSIQQEMETYLDEVDWKMNPQWGNTHYLSDGYFNDTPPFKSFNEELKIHMSQLFQNDYIMTHSWFTLFKENNYAHIHDHIQTDIAGVYYFQLVEDDKDQAELFFVSPLPNDSSYQSVKAKQGELLLFPGWLKHGVTTLMSSDDRVSFSFNLKMRQRND